MKRIEFFQQWIQKFGFCTFTVLDFFTQFEYEKAWFVIIFFNFGVRIRYK